MKKFLLLLLFLVVATLGIGYWRGWFVVEKQTTPDGKTSLNVSINKDKIKQDEATAAKKIGTAIQSVKDKAAGNATPAPAPAPAPAHATK